MSVDKFGRYSKTTVSNQPGPRGVGFELTPEGNFDINGKLLRRVGNPVEPKDAVNLKTLESNCLGYQSSSGKYYAHGRSIGGLGAPSLEDEAVTKKYLTDNTIEPIDVGPGKGNWNCKSKRLCNMNGPVEFHDAINLEYLIKHTCFLHKVKNDSEEVFSARANRIVMVQDGEDALDAVNLTQLLTAKGELAAWTRNNTIYSKEEKGDFNADRRRICFVAPAVSEEDAVTLKQVRERVELLARSIERTFKLKNMLSTEP